MKKYLSVMMIACAMAAVLAGCASKHESAYEETKDAVEQALANYAQEQSAAAATAHEPDPDAPKLEMIAIYTVKDGKTKQVMDGVEMLHEDMILGKLKEYGTVNEEAYIIDYKNDNGTGFIDLGDLKADDELTLTCIAMTYCDDMDFTKITVKKDGQTALEYEDEPESAVGPGAK